VLNGNNGREYKISIGTLSGTAQMFATRRRFYAVVILTPKKDDELTEKFLSSLRLPEKMSPQSLSIAAPTEKSAAPEGANATVAKSSKTETGDDSAKPVGAGSAPTEGKPAEGASEKAIGEGAAINGGVLNGKALYLPAPDYPALAAQAKASGAVNVQVTIDEYGNIISARAISGHPLLQAASVAAARQARFSTTSLSGVPVKVTGILVFNFVAP